MSRGEFLFYGGAVCCTLSFLCLTVIKHFFKKLEDKLLEEVERKL